MDNFLGNIVIDKWKEKLKKYVDKKHLPIDKGWWENKNHGKRF